MQQALVTRPESWESGPTCVVTDTYGSTTSQPAYLYVTANPGGGLGIPAIAQVANEEIPASGAAPTSNVVFDSMNF